MSEADRSAETAFAAAQQITRAPADGAWQSRAEFWASHWFGVDALATATWPNDQWQALWDIALQEHLPPIPGAAHVGASQSGAAAESGLARMREIVGERTKHVHR